MAPKAYSSFFFQIPQLPHTAPPLPTRTAKGNAAPSTTSQFRSFLSLDIADSVLSRSSSIRRRDDDDDESVYSHYTAYSQSTASSFFPATLADDVPRRSRPALATPARPEHSSRSSSTSSQSSFQRALPNPKPAPKATLPDVPSSSSRPTYSRSNTAPSQGRPRTAPSKPKVKIAPQHANALPPSPSHPYSPIAPKPRPASALTGTSAASTNYRRTKRTDALARLEGRTADAAPRSNSPPPYSPSAAMHRTKSAAPVLATKSFMPFSEEDSDSDEDEDDVRGARDVRVELVAMPPSPAPREKKGRARAGTIESWYVGPPQSTPKNFMDFEDVDAYDARPWAGHDQTKWAQAVI